MDTPLEREPFQREGLSRQAEQIAEHFSRIAAGITTQQPNAELTELLKRTEALCAWATPDRGTGELHALLRNLQTALQTWQQVWPRLSGQREFRQAVGREAGLWSKRLTALAKQA